MMSNMESNKIFSSNMKPNDNFIIERRNNIVLYLNTLLPFVISKIISEYDYHFEGKSYVFEGHTNSVTCIAVLSDGRIVSGSRDKTIKVWNANTGLCDITFIDNSEIFCIAALPEAYRIISGSREGELKIWNVNTARARRSTGFCDLTFEKRIDGIPFIAVLPNGNIITNTARCSEIKMWNSHTGICEKTIINERFCALYCVLPDSPYRIVISVGNKLFVYNVQTEKFEVEFKNIVHSIMHVTSHYDYNISGIRLISLEWENPTVDLKLWNVQTGCCDSVFTIRPTIGVSNTCSLCVLANGQIVIENERTLEIWDLQNKQCNTILFGHRGLINDIINLSDGRIATCSIDKTIRIWS